VDGSFGPATGEEANKIDPTWLIVAICTQAKAHYAEIEATKPEMKAWFAAWNKRAGWIPPEKSGDSLIA